MALVIMGYGASAPLLHRQTRLGTIKRLNLALLVNRQDNGVAGRIDIKANDLVQFGGKLGIVGQLELPHLVRLEAKLRYGPSVIRCAECCHPQSLCQKHMAPFADFRDFSVSKKNER
jgi:hypothetical protein